MTEEKYNGPIIREQEAGDLDTLTKIWLESNLAFRPFIPADYWKSQLDSVKAALPGDKVFIFDDHGTIKGFIALKDDAIQGIFIREEFRSQKIENALLNTCKTMHLTLTASVYEEDTETLRLYEESKFERSETLLNKETGYQEILLKWSLMKKKSEK